MFPNSNLSSIILCLPDFWPERVRIPLQTILNRPLSVLLILYIIEAIHAIAQVAKLPVRKAIAVQLQALRFRAVAGFTRTHAVGFQSGIGHRRCGLFDGRRRPHRDSNFGVLRGDERSRYDHHLGGRRARYLDCGARARSRFYRFGDESVCRLESLKSFL